ncbi:DUF1501 domain-containing protein [Rubinisphaera sp.]|uniref:DUF1501 domain-containing protein n=1 Tax=Rubinisphaera sp. TaxID=2024857 RepID=UPI000C0D44CA|nr:DUF1501 domain-containing protein [Rubinisphaera sp.]MBV08268.1 sulfatase [Rubinisphaera sp.]HCS49983.1 DUF1501 domain-containing protein [Planctomycetaceae bacterium]|tara:strand:+ start:2349 stop:3734 length:1386 start_codon:yes stop_codon:yes gene_type:complete
MKQLQKTRKGCTGFRKMSRRDVLQAGVFGALGLSLGDMLRLEACGSDAFTQASGTKKEAKALSVIQLHLPGGFQQQESFDPKPEAPVEIRGSFGVSKTKSGDVLSDNFPETAKIADKVTILRSLVGRVPDHGLATYHLFTGYPKTAVIDYPQMASIVSHELGKRGELPPYVAIPNKHSFSGGTGFISSAFGPFELGSDPGSRGYQVRDFSIPKEVSTDRFQRRLSSREIIEQRLREQQVDPNTLETMDDFYKQAQTLLTSSQAQAAFKLDEESEATFQLYGRDVVGLKGPDNKYHPKGLAERLIVARRLVESGVRFVTVNYGSWDCHVDVQKNTLDQMPALDHAIAGMVADLDQRGMLDSTIFWVTSEFGRTPKVNRDGGRDHHARCYSNLIAGGGFTRGQFYGSSDATGAEPGRDALPLEDLLFTIYHQLGIDANKELLAFGTRPIEIIKDGKLVEGLLS